MSNPLTFGLQVLTPSLNEYKQRYLADVLKYHIVCDNDKVAGIYFANDQLVQRTWKDVSRHTTISGEPGPIRPGEIVSQNKRVQWEFITTSPGISRTEGHDLVITTAIQVQYSDGNWWNIMAPAIWRQALLFRFLLDTGSNVNSWVFWETAEPHFLPGTLTPNGKPFHDEESTRKEWEDERWMMKNKVPYDSFANSSEYDRANLPYGVSGTRVEVYQANTNLTLVDEGRRFVLEEFPLGLAYRFNPILLTTHYDGVLAMGPCCNEEPDPIDEMGRPTQRGKVEGLLHRLVKTQAITKPIYYIFVKHTIWHYQRVYSMISIGGWTANFDIQDEHSEEFVVPCTDSADHKKFWALHLESISLRGKSFNIDATVRIDSGASQSYLPVDPCIAIHKHLVDDLGAVNEGYAPTEHLCDWVTFEFSAGTTRYTVQGQISRFFVSSDLFEDQHTCGVSPSADIHMLGLNFFRTFVVGFEDGRQPKIHLIRQRLVMKDELKR